MDQAAPGVGVSSHLAGEVSTTANELEIAGVMAEGLLVDQKDPLKLPPIRNSLAHDPRIPLPGRPILETELEVLAQRLLGLFRIIAVLGAASTVQYGRSVPPDLDAMHNVHDNPKHNGDRNQEQ